MNINDARHLSMHRRGIKTTTRAQIKVMMTGAAIKKCSQFCDFSEHDIAKNTSYVPHWQRAISYSMSLPIVGGEKSFRIILEAMACVDEEDKFNGFFETIDELNDNFVYEVWYCLYDFDRAVITRTTHSNHK